MNYPLEKYEYIKHTLPNGQTEIIAKSTYAGKTIRGRAKCHPNDKFKEEIGRKLAALRCGSKVAEKRANNANRKLNIASNELEMAQAKYDKALIFAKDATRKMAEADDELSQFRNSLMRNK